MVTRRATPARLPGAPLRLLLAVLGALLLAGCSGWDGEPDGAAGPAPRSDVEFMQAMIHHHAQALRMTSLVPTRTASRDVPLLARRMEPRQEAELELMRSWLAERGEEAPELHRPHGHAHGPALMPGMLTEEELEELAAARGERFDRLFLESMIRHHEGALTMVQVLHATGGGLEPEIGAFARHVEADQAIEIGRMQELLAKLGAS